MKTENRLSRHSSVETTPPPLRPWAKGNYSFYAREIYISLASANFLAGISVTLYR